MDFAQLTLEGRLTDDPKMSVAGSGTSICKFKVACNRRIPGNNEEKTAFIPITVFGNDAANCGKFLSKGRTVHVTGDFETDSYEDNKGIRRTGFGVVARNVIFGYGGRDTHSERGITEEDLTEEQKEAVIRALRSRHR